ncbi:MAG: hypothetical protein KatS3mg023_2600 [Armatimonadota bacterium]|nr:MAG: hypothetical protein KatS3mg023_2600 [Armatimonadota bacterium]
MKRSGQYGWMGVLCLLLLGMSSPLCAKVVYVSPQGDDLQDGLSWTTAKRTVTAALQTALPGDEVWVRYGVYDERITLQSGVSLYGGFRGTESSLSERPTFPRPQPDPYETVLDGNQGGSVVTSPDSADQAFRLDGFTIRNGKAEYGGGLYLTASANLLTVANCTIAHNSATYDGGGVYCIDSSPKLTGCTIVHNSATYDGGGLYCTDNSFPWLTSCTFSVNNASSGGGVFCVQSSPLFIESILSGNFALFGGGISCLNASPMLMDCAISHNHARYDGGGLHCHESSPELIGCVISGNSVLGAGAGLFGVVHSHLVLNSCTIFANSSGGDGGGMFCDIHSFLTLTRCAVSANSAGASGGGVFCVGSSSLTMTNSIVSANNSTDYSGGGVFCSDYSSLTMTNCIVSANSAGTSGGGVFCSDYSSLAMTNCTIDHNISADAGGVWTDNTDTGVQNSILVLNTGGGIRSPVPSTFRHNCVWGNEPYNFEGDIGDPIGTDGNISEEPLLVAWHLLPGSPCINGGDNTLVNTDIDIDVEERIGDDMVDIGADEFHAPIVQGYLLFNDFVGSLPIWVDWEIRTDIIERRVPLLAPDGGFVVPGVPVGQFALSVKPLSYLRRTVEVDTGGGSVLGLVISLTNGDIDRDNEVTLFDFGRLVAAFGSMLGDEKWDVRADLDGDGEVTLFDFGVLVRHFGEIGDE